MLGTRLPNLTRIVEQVTCLPLTSGNNIRELGPQTTYSEMLASIDQAQSSIALCTYIFDRDPIGRRFVEALAGAQKRGVEVRVLIDDVGAALEACVSSGDATVNVVPNAISESDSRLGMTFAHYHC